MKKSFNEFFHLSQQEKICEKAMLVRAAASVLIIVICLAVMGTSAYAYFTCNVTSNSNVLKAATFEVQVKVTDQNGADLPVSGRNELAVSLKAGETYTVEIERVGDAKTGFVIIKAEGCNMVYYTCQLGKGTEGNISDITFTLMPTFDTTVTFDRSWGTSSYFADYVNNGINKEEYIIDNESIKMIVNGITNPASYSLDDTSEDNINQENNEQQIDTAEEQENEKNSIWELIQNE